MRNPTVIDRTRRWCIAALLILVAPTGLCAVGEDKAAAPAATRPAPSAAEIAEWIGQLNDDRYLIRETATRHLLDAGPAVLDQLQATADSDRPEPADRSVWILRRLSNAKEMPLKRQALEHLAGLKKRPQVAAAARESLESLEHQEALEAIEQLGGNYVEGDLVVQAGTIGRTGRLDLDGRWHGTDADLIHLRHLRSMHALRVVGTDISPAALIGELPNCKKLQIVWLYGTKMTPEDVTKLRKSMPANVEIDYRKGALLGVASTMPDGPGPAVVRAVTPGSAAALAGIQAGDVIEKFNGEPLVNFKALTQKIGDHRPGDEVTLTIRRAQPDNQGGQPTDVKVKLGQWKSLDE